MKPTFSIFTAALITANFVATAPAFCANMDSLPPEMKQGEVSFVTGGIGKNEAMAFRHDAKNFPLEMEFVMKDKPKDAFLADVKVIIRNQAGKAVLNTMSRGPFLLATLPPGKYNITANIDGAVKHETVNVDAHKHERTLLVWPNTTRLNS